MVRVADRQNKVYTLSMKNDGRFKKGHKLNIGRRKSLEGVFLNKVNKTENCWLWTGACDTFGYGHFGKLCPPKVKMVKAHRFSYELHKGKIPEGMCVLHSCDTPPCVNPKHLWLGTKKDNMIDMIKKKRNRFT